MNVRLRLWTDADLPVLEAVNTHAMTVHLAGPETAARVRRRHEQYVRGWDTDQPRMFTVRRLQDDAALGSIGWWQSQWKGAECFETGWAVLPEFQRMGVATAALGLMIEEARHRGLSGILMACPNVDNVASNAVCRKAGLAHRGTIVDDYRGVVMTLNAWVVDLGARPQITPPRP
ncbi:GNAT family N-acetyltransferase [Demequina salsinemoris]|uniref:GNAT family N-acetyltransferase n=1 Tax=Demequina salsinemoris TaxID=577470 RepID=UPI0007815C69|nr:GNAT family N-acetyltransferase [Demequina salsinemoris]